MVHTPGNIETGNNNDCMILQLTPKHNVRDETNGQIFLPIYDTDIAM